MPFPNKDTQFKPGESGNPAGKPKGSKHISTWIRDLLNDEEFTLDNFLFNGKQFKGAPIKAIVTVAIMNALQGDNKWAEWLAKHGYGTKQVIEVNDPRKEILDKYMGADDVGQTPQAESRPPTDTT